MKMTRIKVACGVCATPVELTPYQLAHRTLPAACSRQHARILKSLKEAREDAAGRMLAQLVTETGGVEQLASRLRCHRTTLQLLMRTPGRIPHGALVQRLAEVSGKTPEEMLGIFGVRSHARTDAIIAIVRDRFPRDRARLTIVDRLEREHSTVRAYARSVGVHENSLYEWLPGKHKFLPEASLRAIAKHEQLTLRSVGIPRQTAKAARQRNAALGRKKLLRRKHQTKSDHMRAALSASKKQQWADPDWHETKGAAVLDKMHAGRRNFKASEKRYLTGLVRQYANHANHRRRSRAVKPVDVLLVLARVLRVYRRQFPHSAVTIETVATQAASLLGEPLHNYLQIGGRPYPVKDVAALVRLAASVPKPDPFWKSASQHLYDDDTRANDAIKLHERAWEQIPIPQRDHVVEAILGTPVVSGTAEDLFRIKIGRPKTN